MSLRYLLDTNIVSDLVRHPQGRVAAKTAKVGEAAIAASVIVAAELRYGAAKTGSARQIAQVEAILAAMTVLPAEPPADQSYASIRVALEVVGTPIGGNDLIIAAQARALDLTLVTANEREFGRVDGLRVENWLG